MRVRREKRRPGRRCFPHTASLGPGPPDLATQTAQPRGHARYPAASALETCRPTRDGSAEINLDLRSKSVTITSTDIFAVVLGDRHGG